MFDNDDYTDYKLCPQYWRFNCASYLLYCDRCGACSGEFNKSLEYVPLDNSLKKTKHPFYMEKKKDAKEQLKLDKKIKSSTDTSRQVKTALRNERRDLKKLGATLTVGSGRIFNDGDGYTTINGIKYYIEYKQRFSDKASILPTKAEWIKATSQGAKLVIINSSNEDIVVMSKQTFIELLNLC